VGRTSPKLDIVSSICKKHVTVRRAILPLATIVGLSSGRIIFNKRDSRDVAANIPGKQSSFDMNDAPIMDMTVRIGCCCRIRGSSKASLADCMIGACRTEQRLPSAMYVVNMFCCTCRV
jgi:hypothetical protein